MNVMHHRTGSIIYIQATGRTSERRVSRSRRSARGSGLLLAVLAGALSASCKDASTPTSVVELTFEGQAELFPGLKFSTGLLPEGSPVQASFTVSAHGTGAVVAAAAPSGSEAAPVLTGLPGRGTLTIDGSFALLGRLKVDITGLPSYDGAIPGLDDITIPVEGAAVFDPFALAMSAEVRAEIPATRLPEIPLTGGIPGRLVLEIGAGSYMQLALTGICAGIEGTRADYSGRIERSGTLEIRPSVEIEVPLVGEKVFDIPSFSVDLELGETIVDMSAVVDAFGAQPEGEVANGPCVGSGTGFGDPGSTSDTGTAGGSSSSGTTDGAGESSSSGPGSTTEPGTSGTSGGEFGNCGWDLNSEYYACGFQGEDPSGVFPIACPQNLPQRGDRCDGQIDGYGCCAPNGDNYYCSQVGIIIDPCGG